MLDTYHVPSSDFRMVHAGEVAVEAAMIAFAQEKVKEAIRSVISNRIPTLAEDLVYLEQFINYVLREDYPIDEKII